jgi:hypothetical protein
MRRICSISLYNYGYGVYCYGYGVYCMVVGSHPDKKKDDGGRVAISASIPRMAPDSD